MPNVAAAAEQGDEVEALGLGEVAGQGGEGAPGEGEAGVGVEPASEEFEVVAGHQQGPDDDEGQQTGPTLGTPASPSDHCRRERGAGRQPQAPVGEAGP